MDANGTRFHLVLGRDDWFPAGPPPEPEGSPPEHGPRWDDGSASVGLARLPFTFPARRHENPPSITDRRGAGRDRHGSWYWIGDDERGIVARGHHDAAPLPFWPDDAAEPAPPAPAPGDFAAADPAPAPAPLRLRGLAVTGEHYLAVGVPEENGILVFDLAAGGPPVAVRWPDDVRLAAWDVCAGADGGVWILDRENARLWSLDRLFRVRAPRPPPAVPRDPDFVPADGGADGEDGDDTLREGPITADAAVDVSRVADPTAVEVLCDGSVLVLGRGADGPLLHRFTLDDGWTHDVAIAPALDAYPDVRAELPWAHELAFVPGDGCGRHALEGQLLLVTPDGNQSFAFTLSGPLDALTLVLDPRFLPMRRYGGRALVSAAGEAHYDSGDRWVSLLEYPRPLFAREAVLTLPARAGMAAPGEEAVPAFDGREPGCVWHRLFLDGCIPPESSVTVESRAADDAAALEAAPWTLEPAPYLRMDGPELPFRATWPDGPDGQAGTWELLFQNAVGRWLQLRVTLRGNGRITPRVRAVRAYYPRFSYLREYLPAAYREDAGSAWFLDRWLANVEGTFTALEDRIAAAQVLFDPATVPAEFLEWLGGWMGAAADAAWSEEKKRVFLAHAMEMFAGRGTREGLIRALRLALEECVDPTLFRGTSASPPASSSPSASTAMKAGGCGCGCGGGSGAAPTDAGDAARFTVRVVEQFLARGAAGVAYGDVGALAGPGTTTTALEWTPAQGPEPLHDRWRDWLRGEYGDIDALNVAWGLADPVPTARESEDDALFPPLSLPTVPSTTFALEPAHASTGTTDTAEAEDAPFTSFDDPRLALPVTEPDREAEAEDWSRFLREGLGFTWAVPDSGGDVQLWRDFLARRYRQPGDLARAWQLSAAEAPASFDAVSYPASLPEQRTRLGDWITFVSVVVPMRRGAHRFTVLVPVAPGDDQDAQRGRRELARRIALLEKPAHTVVETRLYWAAFRVGEARLGTDTLLGQGSRFTALLLDRGELGGAHLGWTEPWNVRGRLVVGRDPVSTGPHSGFTQRWT